MSIGGLRSDDRKLGYRPMMHWQPAAFALVVKLLLAACASTEAVLEEWTGAPKPELLRRWGRPNQIMETASGGEVLDYTYEYVVTLPDRLGIQPRLGSQLRYTDHLLWCQTRFEVSKDDTIVSFDVRGNACRPIKRR